MAGRDNGAQIIIGLPSFMEADTIGHVTRQVDLGLSRYFPGMRSVIVNADNNSEDDTRGAFLAADTAARKHYIATPEFVRGKGNNLRNLFRFALKHGSTHRAAAVFDTDLKSITPEWVKLMVEPILKGYDFCFPAYSRHQFDGTITNHICHPLLYGLLGTNIRQPIGGEYAFSPAMVRYFMERKWPADAKLYGIDIFMTLCAVFSGMKMCEAGLGVKVHKASAPKLGPMFTQVVHTLFDLLLEERDRWIPGGIDTMPVPRFGPENLEVPQELAVDIAGMKERLKREFFQHEKVIEKIIGGFLFDGIRGMAERDNYCYDILMWTQTVYRFLFAYDRASPRSSAAIIEALKPLHLARSLTFNYETHRLRIDQAEELVREQARAFAAQKPFLMGLYAEANSKKFN